MEIDLKTISAFALEHAGASISTIASTMGLGLLVTIAVIVAFGKFGVFRRPGYRGWHILSKFWIPFLLISGLVVSFKIGMIRAAHQALERVAPSTVDAIYSATVGDALASEADKRAFLLSVQERAKGTQDLGKALAQALKERMHAVPDSAQTLGSKAASLLAGAVIDHYQEDITAAVLYGIYAKTNGYLELHHSGEPVDYSTFKEGMDHLLKMDVATMERGIKDNLGDVTNGLLKRYYRDFMIGAWVLAAVLAAVPLLDLFAYRLVVRQGQQAAAAAEGPGPQA